MPKPLPPLDDFDLGVLAERGVAVETARRNRLHTDPEAGALVIPFVSLDGTFNCYTVRRPHTPPLVDGKPRKYVSPAGQPSRLYVPAESRDVLRDPSVPAVLTEGMLKALVLAQHGYAAAGLLGVWNWKKKGTDELLPDLAAVPWTGRDVFIVFDYDPKPDTRRNVDLARRRLARAIRAAGAAEVYSVELPPGSGGAKLGVDDFIKANGPDAFRELVGRAEPVPPPDAYHPIIRAEGRTDASNAARLVSRYGDGMRWVGPWNKWLMWDGTRWKPDTTRRLDGRAKHIAADLFAEIAAVLKANEGAGNEHRRPYPEGDVRPRQALQQPGRHREHDRPGPGRTGYRPGRAGLRPVVLQRRERDAGPADRGTPGAPPGGLHHEARPGRVRPGRRVPRVGGVPGDDLRRQPGVDRVRPPTGRVLPDRGDGGTHTAVPVRNRGEREVHVRRDGLEADGAGLLDEGRPGPEVGKFLDDYCESGDFLAPAGGLYRAFKEAMPDSRVTRHAFGARLRQKGFLNHDPATGREYRTNKGKHGWKGLRLRSDAEREAREEAAKRFVEGVRAKHARG